MKISSNTVYENNGANTAQVMTITDTAGFDGYLNARDDYTLKDCYTQPPQEAWMPERLQSVTLIMPPVRLGMQYGEYDTTLRTETVDICPQWYSDLAQIPANPDMPGYSAKVAEYYDKLKAAMEEVLNKNKIRPQMWGEHYTNLIADEEKSKKIQAELMETLQSDPHTARLMEELGIPLSMPAPQTQSAAIDVLPDNDTDETLAKNMRVHEEIQAKMRQMMREMQKDPDYLQKLVAASGLKMFSMA